MPELLTDAELTAIADSLYSAGVYPDSCVIHTPGTSVDATGAPVTTTTTQTVACRVDAPARQPVEAVGGARLGPVSDYDVYLYPRTTAVTSESHIVVNGQTLYVIADQDAVSFAVDLKVATKVVK